MPYLDLVIIEWKGWIREEETVAGIWEEGIEVVRSEEEEEVKGKLELAVELGDMGRLVVKTII